MDAVHNHDGVTIIGDDSFGQDFYLSRRKDWSNEYIDYVKLMEFLIEMKEHFIVQRKVSRRIKELHKIERSKKSDKRKRVKSLDALADLIRRKKKTTEIQSNSDNYSVEVQDSQQQVVLSTLKRTLSNASTWSAQQPATLTRTFSNASNWSIESNASSISDNSSADTKRRRTAFCAILDSEIEKVGLFFLKEQGRIANAMKDIAKELSKINSKANNIVSGNHLASIDDDNHNIEWEVTLLVQTTTDRCYNIGLDLLELYHYVAINMTVLRKVLDRHDAIVRKLSMVSSSKAPSPDELLGEYYMRTATTQNTSGLQNEPSLLSLSSYLRTLLHHDGLLSMIGSLQKTLANLYTTNKQLGMTFHHDDGRNSFPVVTEIQRGEEEEAAFIFKDDFQVISDKMKNGKKQTWKNYVVDGSFIQFEPSVLNDEFITEFSTPEKQEDVDMRYYRIWRLRQHHQDELRLRRIIKGEDGDQGLNGDIELQPPGPESLRDISEAIKEEQKQQQEEKIVKIVREESWSLGMWLNLLSTFFYMTNYFIAGPTSVRYMDAVGGDAALASMVIGATPWAVLISTFVFSLWTSFNFKAPLLCSCVVIALGNYLYGAALGFDSIEMVLLGRVLIGFGSPRVINRRYIADTATLRQRTAVSAAFVTCSAAGTAVGPGLAIMLQKIDTTITMPVFGTIILNGLTCPGYFMFLVWLLVSLTIIVAFEEPERIGLQEQPASSDSTVASNTHDGEIEDSIENNVSKSCTKVVEFSDLHETIDSFKKDETETKPLLMANDGTASDDGIKEPNTSYGTGFGAEANDSNDERELMEEAMKVKNAMLLEDDTAATRRCCCRGLTWPVVMCMMLLFVDKLAMESIMSSSPILTETRYDWTVHMIGSLGLIMGMLVIPLSICIGWLSRRYEDGQLLLGLLGFTMIGLVLLFDMKDILVNIFGDEKDYKLPGVRSHRYVYGCLISFSGLQAMEGIIMSTLSKVVPYSLAIGMCNSGLINTEIGTLGRAIGDSVVTFLGLIDLENLLDLLVIPLILLMITCILVVKFNYQVFVI